MFANSYYPLRWTVDKETQPAFFGRRQSPLSKLLWFGATSLILLFTDSRFRYLETIRDNVSVALYPLQQAAMLPGKWMGSTQEFLTEQATLKQENQQLRLDRLRVTARLQEADELAAENTALRKMLTLSLSYPERGQVSEMLYAGRDPFTRKIIIDKGKSNNLTEGSPVLDAAGLVGQVTRVHQLMAEVTLITDKGFPVPVEITRTHQRTVVYGTGQDGWLEVRYLALNSDIKPGDTLATSGIDGTYPAGLIVARVERVERAGGQPFARIWCKPIGGVDRSRHYLVLGKPAELPEYPASALPAEKPKKSVKAKKHAP
ncbi:rod shape-determining protein MreC [Leeia oryzae]|uniref:rod shape-determining protein MreC n=1 Tax=Leeia oryzae TaxID=356662 RepID=UPI00036DED8A|nr:rod shape-determining protein MreC [Leeia oryzae]